MSQLFGFSIKSKQEELKGQSPIPPAADDAVTTVAGGYFGSYVDIDGVARNEFDLIRRYRDMSLHPEVDSAIDEIVNESINSGLDDSPVSIELSNLEVSESIKKESEKSLIISNVCYTLIPELMKFLELGILMVGYIIIKSSILLILKQVFLNSDTSIHLESKK